MWNYEEDTSAVEPALKQALLIRLGTILRKLDHERLSHIHAEAIFQLEEQQWLAEDC
jgi:hypothetical protein